MSQPSREAELDALEARKTQLAGGWSPCRSRPPRLHPNLAEKVITKLVARAGLNASNFNLKLLIAHSYEGYRFER
jgi:hypothetical protein